VQAAYPFVAEGGLGGRGVYIGRDVYGGSFCYDPWELYGKELTSPNAVVIGIVGRAKSSLIKTYVLRQSVFGRQAWIVDVKGEYERLAQATACQTIRFPGGHVALNPLTPRAVRATAQNPHFVGAAAQTSDTGGEAGRSRGAPGFHPLIGQRVPSPDDVVDVLVRPTAEMATALARDRRRDRTCRAPDGVRPRPLCAETSKESTARPPQDSTSTRLSLSEPQGVLNTHTTALGILMTCATAWLQAQIDADGRTVGQTDRRRDERGIPSSLGIGEWLQ
jgi:hypothetical protein